MARMSSEYLANAVASKGYVYVSGMQMFCKVVLIGATKYTRMCVQIYPKIQGYSFSYVNDHKMSWYRMGSSISCDCYSSVLAHHDVSTVVQTLVEQTQLHVFVESVKY